LSSKNTMHTGTKICAGLLAPMKDSDIMSPDEYSKILAEIERFVDEDPNSGNSGILSAFQSLKRYQKRRHFTTIPIPRSHLNKIKENALVVSLWSEVLQQCKRIADKYLMQKYPQDAWQANDAYSFFYDSLFRDPYYKLNPRLETASPRVATIGSCFANNIATSLQKEGVHVFQAPIAEMFNNPWINRLMLSCEYILTDAGRYEVKPNDSFSEFLYNYDRRRGSDGQFTYSDHIGRFIQECRSCHLIVFTVGTAFVAIENKSGLRIPFVEGSFMGRFSHLLLDINEIYDHLKCIYQILRSLNSNASIIFTLSPIPCEGVIGSTMSPVEFDCLSKSISRIGLSKLLDDPEVTADYFPSYEIIRWLAPAVRTNDFSWTDPRHPPQSLIDLVMKIFKDRFMAKANPQDLI
jgi:hypothetical protein